MDTIGRVWKSEFWPIWPFVVKTDPLRLDFSDACHISSTYYVAYAKLS